MHKKDYELLTQVIRNAHPYNSKDKATIDSLIQWETTKEILAAALQANNPRFNEEKFLEACEYSPNANANDSY